MTAVGGLLSLTGVGAVVGAPMMAIGGAMTTFGGIAATAGSMYTMADNMLEARSPKRVAGGQNITGSPGRRGRSSRRNYGRA